jgi:hypothetical protein
MFIAILFGFFVAKMSSVTIADKDCSVVNYEKEYCKEAKAVKEFSENFK